MKFFNLKNNFKYKKRIGWTTNIYETKRRLFSVLQWDGIVRYFLTLTLLELEHVGKASLQTQQPYVVKELL